MSVLKKSIPILLVFSVLTSFGYAWGQMVPSGMGPAGQYKFSDGSRNSYISIGLRKYISSFTSYEFLDPDYTFVDPASRLEWPWEQTYGVVKAGIVYKGLQLNLEGASTLLTYSDLKAQDSDWTDRNLPSQKTVFSEAEAYPRGWTIDASVGFDLPVLESVRWILGYRAQQFRFTYTDMYQKELYEPEGNGFSGGEIIHFTQDFRHYYGGAVIGSSVELSILTPSLAGTFVDFRLLGDVGYVTANNVDFHVIRTPAPRYTYEKTHGVSWRINASADLRITQRFLVGIAGEFMRIRTGGSHRMTHPAGWDGTQNVPATDETWQGARVWSDQSFIELNGSVNF